MRKISKERIAINVKQQANKFMKWCALGMFLGIFFGLIGCSSEGKGNLDELFDSKELILQFPEELSEYVIRERSTQDAITTETFYIKNGDTPIPLFRIDVGSQHMGDWLGVLKTKHGNIPVTYTVFLISKEDMASLGENGEALYEDLMNGFNVTLDGIYSDPRFSSEKLIEVVGGESMAMRYWTVNLPSNMWIEEKDEGGNYEAVFYTNIQGSMVKLYIVRIGDVKAETELGMFTIDGTKKTVSIGSFEAPENLKWTDDDHATFYRMMDSMNSVIQQIMSSKNYSEFNEE